MKCSHCGKELHDDDRYCTYCGKRVSRSKKIFAMPVVLVCLLVGLIVVAVGVSQPSMPKGMYAMHDSSGNMIASLSLREDGTYVLQDEQDYRSITDNGQIVFAHDFEIGKNGLEWDKRESGRIHRSGELNVYEIDGFVGGLYDRKHDMYLFDADDVIYLYEKGRPDATVWVLSKI